MSPKTAFVVSGVVLGKRPMMSKQQPDQVWKRFVNVQSMGCTPEIECDESVYNKVQIGEEGTFSGVIVMNGYRPALLANSFVPENGKK